MRALQAKGEPCIQWNVMPHNGRIGAFEDTENPVLLVKNPADGLRCVDVQRLKFAKVEQACYSVNVGASQQDSDNRRMPGRMRWSKGWSGKNLVAQIWGCVEKKVFGGVQRHHHLSLGPYPGTKFPCPHSRAVRAGTIPLGKATPGRGAEDRNAHTDLSLQFGVRVRANFAVQANFFVLRGCPFHSRISLFE